jgi:hypothetical protein
MKPPITSRKLVSKRRDPSQAVRTWCQKRSGEYRHTKNGNGHSARSIIKHVGKDGSNTLYYISQSGNARSGVLELTVSGLDVQE